MTQPDQPSLRRRIVVGWDGSKQASFALAWAVRFAKDHDADLDVVTTWQWPTSYAAGISFGDWSPEQDATNIAAEAMDQIDLPRERARTLILRGDAGLHLVDAARGAELLVVGNRGHNDLSDIFLGSVSTHCVHHASCTVVIARDLPGVEDVRPN